MMRTHPLYTGATLSLLLACGDDLPASANQADGTTSSSLTSSTGDTDTSTSGTGTDTDVETGTTGPMACMGDGECTEVSAPFCVGEVCSACSAFEGAEADAACAELSADAPLCVGDACVQCTAAETTACGGETPLCDVPTNTCVGCNFHEECQALGMPACDMAVGSCFGVDEVTEVDAGVAGTLQAAIDAVGDAERRAVVLTGGGQIHTVTIDGGKTIAIVSNTTTVRQVRGESGAPTITVTGAGTTAYLHRLRVDLNSDDWGAVVSSGARLYGDSAQVVQNTGGGIRAEGGATLNLRNCFVGGGTNVDAVSANNATLEILYSTLGTNTFGADVALLCNGGITVVRNSLITLQGGGGELACDNATVTYTALETATPGIGNVTLPSFDAGWFVDYDLGDFSLTGSAPAALATAALWTFGDPPFDIDDDPRPSTNETADYAGADIP